MSAIFQGWTLDDKRRILNLDLLYIQTGRLSDKAPNRIVRVDVTGRTAAERAQDDSLIRRISDQEFAFLQQYHEFQWQANQADAGGDSEGAIRAYRQMAELAPWDAIAPMSIGVIYAHGGKFAEGLEWLERAAQVDPGNERVQQNLHAVRAAAGARAHVGRAHAPAPPQAPAAPATRPAQPPRSIQQAVDEFRSAVMSATEPPRAACAGSAHEPKRSDEVMSPRAASDGPAALDDHLRLRLPAQGGPQRLELVRAAVLNAEKPGEVRFDLHQRLLVVEGTLATTSFWRLDTWEPAGAAAMPQSPELEKLSSGANDWDLKVHVSPSGKRWMLSIANNKPFQFLTTGELTLVWDAEARQLLSSLRVVGQSAGLFRHYPILGPADIHVGVVRVSMVGGKLIPSSELRIGKRKAPNQQIDLQRPDHMRNFGRTIARAALSADERFLAVLTTPDRDQGRITRPSSVIILDTSNWQQAREAETDAIEIAFLPAGGLIGWRWSEERKATEIVELATGKRLQQFAADECLEYSTYNGGYFVATPDCRLMAARTKTRIYLWNPLQGGRLADAEIPWEGAAHLAISPDAAYLAVSGTNQVAVYRIQPIATKRIPASAPARGDEVSCAVPADRKREPQVDLWLDKAQVPGVLTREHPLVAILVGEFQWHLFDCAARFSRLPAPLARNLPPDRARQLQAKLTAVGAVVSLRPSATAPAEAALQEGTSVSFDERRFRELAAQKGWPGDRVAQAAKSILQCIANPPSAAEAVDAWDAIGGASQELVVRCIAAASSFEAYAVALLAQSPCPPKYVYHLYEAAGRLRGVSLSKPTASAASAPATRDAGPPADAATPKIALRLEEPSPQGPMPVLDTKELAVLAARRRWEGDDLADDRRAGSRRCDQCQEQVRAAEGYLIEPAPPRKPGQLPPMTDEVTRLNQVVKGAWESLNLSTGHCDRCGLALPTGGGALSGGIAGFVNTLVRQQNMDPQRGAAAIKLCQAYFGGDEQFTMPDNALFLSNAVLGFAQPAECKRCQAKICRRCQKLPHDEEGCVICTEARTSGPRIVCETCFAKQDVESVRLKTLAAVWGGRPDLVPATGREPVSLLLETLDAPQSQVAQAARQALCRLSHPEAVDALCAHWVGSRDARLRDILRQSRFVATQPTEVRVLTALLAEETGVLEGGGVEIVEPLLAAAQDNDEEIAAVARAGLGRLRNPAAQDALCRMVIEDRAPIARDVAVEAGYSPSDETQRALYFYLTRQWDQYKEADRDRSRLREAFESADERLTTRMRQIAQEDNRLEWVYAALGGPSMERLSHVSAKQWQAIADVMSNRRQWPAMWVLARSAPARWSVEFLRRLGRSDWSPPESEREKYRALVRLAAAWPERRSEQLPTCRALLEGQEAAALFEGRNGVVVNLTMSRDGRLLAGSFFDKIVLWNLPDGGPPTTVKEPKHSVRCLAMRPDGRLLASVSSDNTIRLWRLPDGRPLKTLEGHKDLVYSLAMSRDGRMLASGDYKGLVRLWSLTDGRLLANLPGHTALVRSLVFTGDGRLLASAGDDSKVRLWSLPDGKHLKTLEGHTDMVFCLAVTEDGHLLASGARDNTIRLWRLPEGQSHRTLKGHCDYVRCLRISQNGRLLISGSNDKTVRLWSLPDRRLARTLRGHAGAVDLLAVQGDLVASAAEGCKEDRSVRLWRLPDGEPLGVLEGHTAAIGGLELSHDLRWLASSAQDKTVRLWDLAPVRTRLLRDRPLTQLTRRDASTFQKMLEAGHLSADDRAVANFILAMADFLGKT